MTTREKSSSSLQPSGAQESAILRALAEKWLKRRQEFDQHGHTAEYLEGLADGRELSAKELLAALSSLPSSAPNDQTDA